MGMYHCVVENITDLVVWLSYHRCPCCVQWFVVVSDAGLCKRSTVGRRHSAATACRCAERFG